MSKSRSCGNEFEYFIARHFVNQNIPFGDVSSKEKFDRLKNANIVLPTATALSSSSWQPPPLPKYVSHLDSLFAKLQFKNIKSITLHPDTDGIKGRSADISLTTDTDIKYISCKNNNTSIKHPRPNALPTQTKMNIADTTAYHQEYAQLNDSYYNTFETQKLTKFSDIPLADKEKMYLKFNQLTVKYIAKLTGEQIAHLFTFIMSCDKTYIISNDTKKKKFVVYDYVNTQIPTTIKSVTCNGKNIKIEFGNNAKINMRIHNASKQITKTLSLKYDTKVENMLNLFTTFEESYH